MKPNPLWRINSEWNKLRKTRESREKLGWKLKQPPRQFTKWGKFFFSAAWKGLNTHTHTLCACSGLAWGIHQAFPKGRFSLLRFGLDVFTVYSSLALNTNLKWNGKEEKREIRALVCSCLQKAAAATPQAATHTHTLRDTHTYLYNIPYLYNIYDFQLEWIFSQ